MRKGKFINEVPEGTPLNAGDEIAVRKGQPGNYRFYNRKVAADDELYPFGITEEEVGKLERLTDYNITKLEEDYTKGQLDVKFQQQDGKIQQTVAETVPVTGTVLPRGSSIPSYITTVGKTELYGGTGGTTYTNTGRPAPDNQFVVPEGYVVTAIYTKSSDTWSLGSTGKLPNNPVLEQVMNGTNKDQAVSEYGIKLYVDDKIISKIGTVNNTKPILSGNDLTIPNGFVINNKSRADFTIQTITLPSGVFRLLFNPTTNLFSSQATSLPVDTKVFWDIGAFYIFGDTIIPVDTTSFFFDWTNISTKNNDVMGVYNGTPTSFNFDFTNSRIVIISNPSNIIYHRNKRYIVPSKTINMTSGAVQILHYRPSLDDFFVTDSGSSLNIPKDDIVIAVYRPSAQYVTMIGDNFAINGQPKNIIVDPLNLLFNVDSLGLYNGTPTSFNFDFTNGQIKTTTSSANIIYHRNKRYVIPTQTLPMTAGSVQILHYDPIANAFAITDSSANLNIPTRNIVMAVYRPTAQIVTMIGDTYAINGVAKGSGSGGNVTNLTTYGIYAGGANYLNFDFANNKIIITAAQSNCIVHKNTRYPITTQEVTMLSGAFQILYLNPTTNMFALVNTGATISIPDNCIIVAVIRVGAKYVSMIGLNFSIDGVPQTKGNGQTKKIVYDMDLNTYYVGETSRSMTIDDPLYIRDTTPEYVNGLFDDLMNLAPEGYITRQQIGTAPTSDHGDIPVYAYSFNPPKTQIAIAKDDYMPKVFINCGTHGGEKMTPFVVYDFLKDMIDNWKDQPFLEFCRFNIPFVIIPVLNCDGWYKNLRVNMNGVDINRNYSVGWTLGTPGTETYGGPEPFSEAESKLIRDFVATITDKFVGIDFHNFSANTNMWYFESHNQFVNNVGRVITQVVSRRIKSKYTWIPQDESAILGYSSIDTLKQGKTAAYLESIGMYALTLETGQGLQLNPDMKVYDNPAFVCGLELFGNFLRIMLKECALNNNCLN